MPSNILSIDSNFPTFTGEEPVEVQIRELHNYLYQLRESLQYSLQNLGSENFNASSLQNLTDEATKALGEELQKLSNTLSQVQNEVKSIAGRISGVDELSGKVTDAEEKIGLLEKRTADVETDVAALQERSAYQEETVGDLKNRADSAEQELSDLKTGAETREQRIDALTEMVESLDADMAELTSKTEVTEDGGMIIGEVGKDLRLVGNIYINGILYEAGGTQ